MTIVCPPLPHKYNKIFRVRVFSAAPQEQIIGAVGPSPTTQGKDQEELKQMKKEKMAARPKTPLRAQKRRQDPQAQKLAGAMHLSSEP